MGKADAIPFKYRRRFLGSPPVSARHVEWSAIASTDDELPAATDELIGIALRAADKARHIDLGPIAERCRSPLEARWVNHWPGDHYRLLAALVEVTAAPEVVEVGTFTGMGALALARGGAFVRTYDVIPWSRFPNTLLQPSDFDHHLEQRIGDLSDSGFLDSQLTALQSAALIFIDGPKDGRFEPLFISKLLPVLRPGQLLLLDDIRKLEMLQLWRDLPLAKLDVTSLGHWSGSGLVIA